MYKKCFSINYQKKKYIKLYTNLLQQYKIRVIELYYFETFCIFAT